MVGLVLVGYAVRRALQKRGLAAVLAPIAAFCAAALAELVLLGAFAVNFAGYSNGYLSGADYFGLFVPWLAQSWEQNVYAGVGTSLAVVLAVFGIVCNARKAEKFFAAHRDWLIAGAVVLVLDLIAAGGNAITVNGKTLFPGSYRVTLTGSGFDHSYIYARYGLINEETYKLDIDFTGIDPNEMTFEFTATEMLHYWRTAVHTLDDANVTVNSVTVEKVG